LITLLKRSAGQQDVVGGHDEWFGKEKEEGGRDGRRDW